MFSTVIKILPHRIQPVFQHMDEALQNTLSQIHLKAGARVYVSVGGKNFYVTPQGKLSEKDGILLFENEVEECFYQICGYSVYSYEEELASGFVTVEGGHRVGICGTAVWKNGRVETVRDISSISIRVASQQRGCADSVYAFCSQTHDNILILSAPGAGKTTLLRDLARRFSCDKKRVCIVDERGEIGAVTNRLSAFDLGDFCDILDRFPKTSGILQAVRTLSPQVVFADELGDEREVNAVIQAMHCGVKVIATAHAADLKDALQRPHLRFLIENGYFTRLILLTDSPAPGTIKDFIKTGGQHESSSYCDHVSDLCICGDVSGHFAEKKSAAITNCLSGDS